MRGLVGERRALQPGLRLALPLRAFERLPQRRAVGLLFRQLEAVLGKGYEVVDEALTKFATSATNELT